MIRSVLYFCFFLSLVAGQDTYLYLPEAEMHPILEFTGDSNRFMDSSSPRVVEFYSPSCPACVAFKEKYIDLATESTLQYPEIEFFAVSCDDHFETCKEYGVEDFPTLKIYKAGEDSGTEITEDDENGYTADQIAELLDMPNESVEKDIQQFRDDSEPEAEDEPDEDDGAKENGEQDGDEDDNDVVMDPKDGENNEDDRDENIDGDESIPADHEETLAPFRREHENIESEPEGDGDINDSEERAPTEPEDEPDQDGDENAQDENDENDENGETDEDSSDGGTSISLEPAKTRRGGALHAKYKPMELNRFRHSLLEKLKDYDRKQKRMGFFGRLFGGKRAKVLGQTAESDALTETMRVNTPGTKEFIARRKAINERIQKARKRWRNRMSTDENMTIGKLPYHKDVRKRSMFRSYAHLSEEEGLILDATHSFIMGLRYGLFLKKDQLDLPQLNAFRDYLDLLGVSLPSEWRLHKLILDLRRNYVKVGKGRSNLLEILEKFPFQEGWSKDCTNGKFTCGFWKLLHTTSVGVAENRGGLNLIESGMIPQSTRTFSPLEAADAIRNYIDNFFTCGPCRKEFIANYDACENNRRCDRLTEEVEGASVADWKELSKWLWEVHNEVSVRVAKTRAEKMNIGLPTKGKRELPAIEQLKVLWPQINDCISCFKEDGNWNEDAIFTFLESKYWHGSEVDPKYDRLLKFEREPSSNSLSLVFLIGLLVIYFVFKSIKGRSNLIQLSVTKTRQFTSTKSWQGKKSRFKD